MRGLVVFGFLISTIIVCVLSENDQRSGAANNDNSEVAVRADQLTHVRSKRSPHEPIVPALLLGKSFLIGALVGKFAGRRGWGWRPRNRGWGWKPAHHGHHEGGWGWKPVHHAPVVVHSHSHGGWSGGSSGGSSGGWGGWSGWQEPVVVSSGGWGWSR